MTNHEPMYERTDEKLRNQRTLRQELHGLLHRIRTDDSEFVGE